MQGKNGDVDYLLGLRPMTELEMCGQSSRRQGLVPTSRETQAQYCYVVPGLRVVLTSSSVPVGRETAGIMWRRIESRACDGSIGRGKTRKRIEWEPGHMELYCSCARALSGCKHSALQTCMCMSMSKSRLLDATRTCNDLSL